MCGTPFSQKGTKGGGCHFTSPFSKSTEVSEGDLLQSIESVSHVREFWKLKKYFILFMRLLFEAKRVNKSRFHENIKFLKDDLIDQPWIPPFCQSHSKFCRVVGKQFSMANKKWGGEGGRGLKFFV